MSPNGKLPFALPNKENEQGMTEAQYPGTPTPDEFHLRTKYTENLSFGYRWYQQHNVQPKFHFGHGLSYGIADLYVTNVMWAREKNSVHFCVENRPGMGQLVDGMKKEAAKKISVPKPEEEYLAATSEGSMAQALFGTTGSFASSPEGPPIGMVVEEAVETGAGNKNGDGEGMFGRETLLRRRKGATAESDAVSARI